MKIERRRIKKEINVEECIFSSNAKKMPFCFVQKDPRENPEKKERNERGDEGAKKNGTREVSENKFFK